MQFKLNIIGSFSFGTFGFSDAATDSLAVESDSRHGIEILVKLESIQSGRLPGTVEPKHRHVERSSRGKGLKQTAARPAPTHPGAHPSSSRFLSFPLTILSSVAIRFSYSLFSSLFGFVLALLSI